MITCYLLKYISPNSGYDRNWDFLFINGWLNHFEHNLTLTIHCFRDWQDYWKTAKMKIITLTKGDNSFVQQAAQFLVDAFRQHWADTWPSLEYGLAEVHEMLEAERICRAAMDDEKKLPGIIGGIPQYGGLMWELHPLAVLPEMQGRGIGKNLVEDFEEQVRARGGLAITLGPDDQDNLTSLANIDLYETCGSGLGVFATTKDIPISSVNMGYVITGVVPDENRVGKSAIITSKRVVM